MRLFLSVYVADIKVSGQTNNMPKMWASLEKKVDLEDPTSLLDQVYLGCTHQPAQVNNRNCGWKTEIVLEAEVKTEEKKKPKTSKPGARRLGRSRAKVC